MHFAFRAVKGVKGVTRFRVAPNLDLGKNPTIWWFGPLSSEYPEIFGTKAINFPFLRFFGGQAI